MLFSRSRSKTAYRVWFALSLLLCQGFYCDLKNDSWNFPGAVIKDIHLVIRDPENHYQGVYLAWDFPSEELVSYFEIYQSRSRDSLKHVVWTQSASDSYFVVLPIIDTARPFTQYFGVRAIYVEPTGQKRRSDSLYIDSITVSPSLNILQPPQGRTVLGRTLEIEVQTSSDPGVIIEMILFEKRSSGWLLKQRGWLPEAIEPRPLFGNSIQSTSLILESLSPEDTVQSLFCVIGTESFQKTTTGLIQSLGCTHFFRVNE